MMNGSRKKHERSAQKDYRFKVNRDKLDDFNKKILNKKSQNRELSEVDKKISIFEAKFKFQIRDNPINTFNLNIENMTNKKYKLVSGNWIDIKKQKLDDDRNERLSSLAVGGDSHVLGL